MHATTDIKENDPQPDASGDSKRLNRWLKSQSHLGEFWLKLSVLLGVINGLLLIAQAWLLALSVNAVIFQDADLAAIRPWLFGLLLIYLVRAALAWAAEQSAFRAAIGVKLALRQQLYEKLQQLGPVRLGRQRTGDLVNSLSDGVEALEAYYARFLPAISLMALVPLSIFVFILPLDWLSALIFLCTAPLIPLFMILIGKGAEKLNQRQWRKLARLSAHFLDVIQGLTTLKLFNASRREADLVSHHADDYRRSAMAVLKIAFLSSLALEFFATVSIALVAVSIGFRLYFGEMDFLFGFFILLLAPEFYLPLRNMGSQYHARMEAIGAAERLAEILALEAPKDNSRLAAIPDLRHASIVVDSLSFAYPHGRLALNGLSFELQPGQRLALVGPSGGGKSTLVNLLLGFIEADQGAIRIGATALDQLPVAAWREQIAWVPQRPRLFAGPIKSNIALGKPDASQSEIEAAAKLAHADEFIAKLPDGYDTQLGEGGAGLSGGQIQRIAIARAILRDAPLVILDEPTAGLDAAAENLVQQGIESLARDKTLLVIAHRLHTVHQADQILVLEQGCIAQRGKHAELIQQPGLYRDLHQKWEAQA